MTKNMTWVPQKFAAMEFKGGVKKKIVMSISTS